ncbi:peptidoglycan-binding protein [Candidatus Uhrbacteria bacterium]|nr:peptidoglycan-binding protein [Candidatus Uhrbacteria bacterium]
MPRMLARVGILVALSAPAFALAAFDDVTLTTDTVLSVGGITLNVSGSSATIESITVNASDFSVTLQSGSTFQVTAPNLNRFSASTLTGVVSDVCNATQSLVKYQPSTSVTVTITPSSILCSSTGGGGGGGSTGGGGSSSPSMTQTTPVTPTTPATTTPATPVTPAVPAVPAVSASGLSASQIQSILDVLASFDADTAIIAKVKASLEGTAATGSVTSTAVSIFKSDLTVGSLGSQVKALQEYLNAHGYTIASNGPGSPGNETTTFGGLTKSALIKFQKAKGITPAAGYFGPKTRAAVNAGS